ncbi:transcriptional regulator [Candidatus Thiodictyon syntrophicum]|uniref:Transcriptional regulator n=1 Tax=Candidatus Thiodictyon syntrophicum TaxID=1166950 RepID=A0A2K8UFE7_9GAMM|nr:transcriptional regulator [Candidatus Thiodictyon syntrophicum]
MNGGDVVLAPLPQADGRVKNRPTIALRRLPGFGDWLLCGVSSQLRQEIAGFDDPIRPGHTDFGTSGLKAPSLIRLGFLAVVPEAKLLGSIGALAPERHRRLLHRLSDYLGPKPLGG